MANILIVDDDVGVRTSLSLLMKQAKHHPLTASEPEESLTVFKDEAVDLVILDMNFSLDTSGEEGLKLLENFKIISREIPVIIITAWGSISLAVKGMKAGAADFITKPWNNDYLLQSVKTALSLSKNGLDSGGQQLTREQLDKIYDFERIIGDDQKLISIMETAGRIAATDAPVLIIGESGTGKELFAEAVHKNSPRKDGPFIKVNLGGIPMSLFESEMFGHKKGAFTDAKFDRMGRFEAAHTGTIFLDEIGELDLNSQVKLLRVLQDRSFEVLGSSKTKTVDVRVISATNKSLEELVADGKFREDLFYRINLITLKVPPLRERPDDIPLLVDKFKGDMQNSDLQQEIEIHEKALAWLKKQKWNGNVRELKNSVERAVLVSNKSMLRIKDFEMNTLTNTRKTDSRELPDVGDMTLDEMERNMIEKTLKFHDNNLSKTAESLGLSRGALYRRMEKYGLSK